MNKWLRRCALLFLLLLAILLIIGYTYVKDPSIWPIRSVSVATELHFVTPTEIKNSVQPFAQASFFAVNMTALQHELQALPWVETAHIERVWPDKLELAIVERRPIARWKQAGLISDNAQLFHPEQEDEFDLPQLSGDDEKYREVLAAFKRFNTQLAAVGLSVVALDLSPRLAWTAQLNNGLALYLGQDDVDARLLRFVKVMPKLQLEQNGAVYVDLRYTNGFVVGNHQS